VELKSVKKLHSEQQEYILLDFIEDKLQRPMQTIGTSQRCETEWF
jgi:hypothetical protein